jgi:hypothetical protein
LANLIERKRSRKGEKINKWQGPKSRQANNPKEVWHKRMLIEVMAIHEALAKTSWNSI